MLRQCWNVSITSRRSADHVVPTVCEPAVKHRAAVRFRAAFPREPLSGHGTAHGAGLSPAPICRRDESKGHNDRLLRPNGFSPRSPHEEQMIF